MERKNVETLIAGLERQGISKKEIANRSGMSYATVWRMANGVGSDHLGGTLQRIEQLQRSIENSPVNKNIG
jgi:transcriptional regulator with XRE-family HTH domain